MNESEIKLFARTEFEMSQGMCLMKFGGASLENADAIYASSHSVLSFEEQGRFPIVVVSAMRGVTDVLRELHYERANTKVAAEIFKSVLGVHVNTVFDLNLGDQLSMDVLTKLYRVGLDLEDELFYNPHESEGSSYDRIVSAGEKMASSIMVASLMANGRAAFGINSENIVVTDNSHGSAHPDRQETRRRAVGIKNGLKKDGSTRIPVITGFIGSTPEGEITTLGANSSDYSAVLLAEAMGISDVYFMKDVDGVYKSSDSIRDPNCLIREISLDNFESVEGNEKLLCKSVKEVARVNNQRLHVVHFRNPTQIGTTITC